MDPQYLKNLERGIKLSKSTPIIKFLNAPLKSIYSKILEIIGLKFGIVFKSMAHTFFGDKMVVFLPEVNSLVYYRYGFNEESVTYMMLKYLKQGMTFIDVGAYLGYFTLMAFNIVGSEGQVHSFEPTPSIFRALSLNTKKRNRIYLNKLAVFYGSKKIYFNDYGRIYSSFNSFYQARLNSLKKIFPKKYIVQAISLDEYVKNKKIRPSFVKIDAESAEYEVLVGMEKVIKKFKPIIILEVGDMNVKDAKRSRDLIFFLIKRGYQPMEYHNGKIMKHKLKQTYSYDNLLFFTKKRIKKKIKHINKGNKILQG